MKIKITKIDTLFTILMMLASLCLSASCSQELNVSRFIDKNSFKKVLKDCENSTVENCSSDHFQKKVSKHCSDNKLAVEDCLEIKLAVTQKFREYMNQEIELERQTAEAMKRAVDELKQGKTGSISR